MAEEPKPVDRVDDARLQTPECKASLNSYSRDAKQYVDTSILLTQSESLHPDDRATLEKSKARLNEDLRVEAYNVEKSCGATTQEIAMHNAGKISAARKNNSGAKP